MKLISSNNLRFVTNRREQSRSCSVSFSLSLLHYLPEVVSDCLKSSLSPLRLRQRQHPQQSREQRHDHEDDDERPPANQTAQTFIISFPSIVERERIRRRKGDNGTFAKKSRRVNGRTSGNLSVWLYAFSETVFAKDR